jgi:twitching motility protein PilT
MENIIRAAVERGASDLHVKAGDVFRARIDGELKPLTKQRLTPDQTKAIALKLIPTEEDRNRIDLIRDYDCSWGAPGVGRFRVNILRQRSSFMVVMRVIPFEVPTLDKLCLPRVFETVADLDRGLVLVAGPSGSGKSSTMAAMVNHINTKNNKHIVTLENPIEFLHRDLNSSVTQREIGADTQNFRTGLRASLRQDPDVIMLGELPDIETLDVAIKAAETGQLLISTLPTPDATTTIARIVAMFPPEEQEVARVRLAEALQAIYAQRLLPRADGGGRVAALEVLVCTPVIRELIGDRNRVGEIRHHIAEGRTEYGMQTFEQHLADMVEGDVIAVETARMAASDPDEIDRLLGWTGQSRSDPGKAASAAKERAEEEVPAKPDSA